MTQNDEHLLFIYGTLKPGFVAGNVIPRQPVNAQVGSCNGYAMYHLGGFPGVVADKGSVYGIVLEFDDEIDMSMVFAVLDPYEGFAAPGSESNQFVRELVDIQVENEVIRAWMYIYVRPLRSSDRKIDGGTWTLQHEADLH